MHWLVQQPNKAALNELFCCKPMDLPASRFHDDPSFGFFGTYKLTGELNETTTPYLSGFLFSKKSLSSQRAPQSLILRSFLLKRRAGQPSEFTTLSFSGIMLLII